MKATSSTRLRQRSARTEDHGGRGNLDHDARSGNVTDKSVRRSSQTEFVRPRSFAWSAINLNGSCSDELKPPCPLTLIVEAFILSTASFQYDARSLCHRHGVEMDGVLPSRRVPSTATLGCRV